MYTGNKIGSNSCITFPFLLNLKSEAKFIIVLDLLELLTLTDLKNSLCKQLIKPFISLFLNS